MIIKLQNILISNDSQCSGSEFAHTGDRIGKCVWRATWEPVAWKMFIHFHPVISLLGMCPKETAEMWKGFMYKDGPHGSVHKWENGNNLTIQQQGDAYEIQGPSLWGLYKKIFEKKWMMWGNTHKIKYSYHAKLP